MKKLLTGVSILTVATVIVAFIKKPKSVYRDDPAEQNPMEGKRVRFVQSDSDEINADGEHGHLEVVGVSKNKRSCYDRYIKRMLDVILSLAGIVILSPMLAVISVLIFIDDPGPIVFTQKRVGKDKQFFQLHKFRSMKIKTPHDVPTHMLSNADQYITNVGKILRQTSLDELPQIVDILLGNMSIIGPRPALWNQDLLVAERDKYGANDVRPGLTGLAQISGRDELGIREKAEQDGKYVSVLSKGGLKALKQDIQCFFGTITSVIRHDGIVEGRTSSLLQDGHKKIVSNDCGNA